MHLVDGVRHRVTQEPLDELVDAVVQRRGEQQPLSAGGCGGQDTGDAGQKAQVSHVIGFVDHGDLDRVEADDALPHQVFEPARAGDDDVDAGTQRRHLTVLRDAAEDGGDLEVVARRPAARASRRSGSPAHGWAPGPDRSVGDARRCMAASRVTIGMEKASVFPLPVLPRPSTSRPASVSGSVFSWIGKGVRIPRAASDSDQSFVHAEISEGL